MSEAKEQMTKFIHETIATIAQVMPEKGALLEEYQTRLEFFQKQKQEMQKDP